MAETGLYKGFAVVIDEAIGTENEDADKIGLLLRKIKEKGIPCCTFNKIPSDEVIANFRSVNFIILDWLLGRPDPETGVTIPTETIIASNIEFLKKIKSTCFTPVFIFTNERKENIIPELVKPENNLYDAEHDDRNFILIANKADLIEGNNLFDAIEAWVKNNPAIYVLKKWEQAFFQAKNDSFWHLFQRSPVWPRILWQAYKKDEVDERSSLSEALYQLIKARTPSIEFKEGLVLGNTPAEFNISEMREVIRGTMYLSKDHIPKNDLQPGDIFEVNGKYYLNVRPACDTVVRRDQFDGYIHAIEGKEVTKEYVRKRNFHKKYGVIEHDNEVLFNGFDEKEFMLFSLKEIKRISYKNSRAKRIVRLLPPFINHVQQKHSAYNGRIGEPRLPDELVKEE